MARRSVICLFTLTLIASEARSQYISPGSTPQGDYLRGLGIFEQGLGSYNRDTAIANSVEANTAIRVNEYLRQVDRQDREYWERLVRNRDEKSKANYNAIDQRKRENPNDVDLMTGDALNKVLDELKDQKIQSSLFRLDPVPLTPSQVRRIPFSLSEKGVTFSMQRFSPRGKGKWPVVFQDDQFVRERKAFDQAVEVTLEQMIEGKMSQKTIADYKSSVRGLENKLEMMNLLKTEPQYREAKARIREMEEVSSNLLQRQKMQGVIADLDCYAGRTVDDLRQFMTKHNLRFSKAELADERDMYPDLYRSLARARDSVTDQGKGRDR